MDPYTIRFATLEDLPDIREMWMAMVREMAQPYPMDMASVATADEFTRQAAHALSNPAFGTYCLVASLADGRPVGFHCFGYQTRELGAPHIVGFCYWVYILAAYRQTALADDLALIAAEHGLARGVSYCEMTRLPGQALRKGLGFEPFEVRSRALLTTVITRLEERRRRRAERASRPKPAPAADTASPDEEEEVALP